jgi:class 3 adenylate cyclase/tetratricopeptide (TPR) repeat protein
MTGAVQGEEQIRAAIAALEAQRGILGDDVVGPAIAALHRQLDEVRDARRDAALEGERRIVTILFADLSGFTALSERSDPEAVRALVNGCFGHLVPIVERYGGTVDKFIGDEIMALFGAPAAHENDPERALRAALEMREALAAFNRERRVDLGLHFGVNTGPVIAGMIGSHDRREYSVMGDAVNLASRLADASERGEILVGATTYRQAAPVFDFEPAARLALKGKSDPVVVHKLQGLKAVPLASRGIDGLWSPLVGRDESLDRLRTALQRLSDGQGSVLAVRGEAGVGKSRLVAEARRSKPEGAAWAEGRCLSLTQGVSYAAARLLLYDLAGVRPDAPLARIEAALRTSIETACAADDHRIFPYLARLLDVPLSPADANTLESLAGAVLQARTLEAFQVLLRATALGQPIAVAWEDLHWADPSTLQLLTTLVPLTRDVPLLFLLAYRPGDGAIGRFQSELLARWPDGVDILDLAALGARDSLTLFGNLLDVGNLPPAVSSAILDRADGNPFFLEELVRALLDSDILSSGDPSEITVPTTLAGVLMARIDGLEPWPRQVLQSASVIGRVFQRSVLARVLRSEEQSNELEAALSELLRREFIRRRGEGSEDDPASDDDFIFKHAITQDVAYESLLIARRKELHARVGQAMEQLFDGRLDEVAADLAHHFTKGEVTDRSVSYLTRAGDRSKAAFANAEAGNFYRQALDQISRARAAGEPEPDDGWNEAEAHLHEHLGDLLELTGNHGAAREAYLEALARTATVASIAAGRRRRKQGLTFMVERRFAEALDGYASAEQILGQPPADEDPSWWEEWVRVQLEHMWVFYWQGRVEDLQARAQASRAAVESRGTPDQRGRFFMMLALSNLRRDRYVVCDETVEYAEAAVAAVHESPALGEHGHIDFVLGFVRLWRGDLDQAVDALTSAMRVAVQVGDVVIQARCLTYLMTAARRQGQVEEGRRLVPQVETMATDLKMVEYVAMARATTAWLAYRGGLPAEAAAAGREALEAWHRMPVPYTFDWMAAWPVIGACLAEDRVEAAVDAARLLLRPDQHPLDDLLEPPVRQAVLAWEQGQPDLARSTLVEAARLARRGGYL